MVQRTAPQIFVPLSKLSSLIYRAGHIALALLLFISSTGVVLNQHYCRGELKSQALFRAAPACHAAQAAATCPLHPHPPASDNKSAKGCCNDETEYFKSDIDQMTTASEVAVPFHSGTGPGLVRALPLLPPIAARPSLQYLHYKPPQLVYNLPLRLQAFLC